MQVKIGIDSRFTAIMIQHGRLKFRRNVAPCVLQDRDQIISRMPGKRILEVNQALLAISQKHDVFRVIIPQHRDLLPFALAQWGKRFTP